MGSIERLGAAVDELVIGADPDELVAVLRQRDRLEARIAEAVGAFDAAELWDLDGATSMTRWLVTEARLGEGGARRLVRTAARLAEWPALTARDRHCRFRGCRRSVDWCEVHHVTHRTHGGTDRTDNCVLLCAYHHHVLHRPRWSAHLEPDGTLVVADPRGRTWATRPPGPGNGPPPTHQLTFGA